MRKLKIRLPDQGVSCESYFCSVMDLKNAEGIRQEWGELIATLTEQFGIQPDLQAVIYLIGVQELGQGFRNFGKDEKQDLMHIATCRLLSSYGYYELSGTDQDGWPHWKLLKKIPPLSLKEQDVLLKRAVLDYFREI